MTRPYRVPGSWPVAALITLGPLVVTIWLIESTVAEEPSAFWVGMVALAVGIAVYPLSRRFLKRDHSDALVDASKIDFGPGIDTAAVLSGGRPATILETLEP